MSMQDPLSDMLTRLRNAQMAGKQTVDMPGSKLKVSVAKVLEQEGYIAGHRYDDSTGKPRLHIDLKYYEGKPVIAEISASASHLCAAILARTICHRCAVGWVSPLCRLPVGS